MILNLSFAPSVFLAAIRVPNQKILSKVEKMLDVMTVCVFNEGSSEGITVYSSKIESRSSVLIPGMDDSAFSSKGIPSG